MNNNINFYKIIVIEYFKNRYKQIIKLILLLLNIIIIY